MDSVNYYFGGGAAAMNLHERLADLLLMELSFSMEDPGTAAPLPRLKLLYSSSSLLKLSHTSATPMQADWSMPAVSVLLARVCSERQLET